MGWNRNTHQSVFGLSKTYEFNLTNIDMISSQKITFSYNKRLLYVCKVCVSVNYFGFVF